MRISQTLLSSTLALVATSAVCAQTPPADAIVELSRFEVEGLPVEQSINPLTRSLEGVFGDLRGVVETPRAVSTISQALMRERGIEGVREFVGYAPGSYAPASYGKATTPHIRGDIAETFLNGQRRSYNLYGYFPSFNNVEAVDLVRGPGSAIYGSGFFTGGYVNYVTKRPKYTPETTVTARIGTWVPDGGSWLNGSWQIDTSAPAQDGRSAWRLSYEGKEDDTFFRRSGARDDRQDLFLAWERRVSDTLTFEANAQYLWQASPELLGINRPTQDLIDHGLYYIGDAADEPDFPGVIPATAAVPIARDATLFSPGDFSNANVAYAQVIATAQLAPDRKLVNRTLLEHVNRRRHHAFEYTEYVTQWTAENRTEWHAALTLGDFEHRVIVGATVRWEDRLSYTNYFNEYFYQYDITRTGEVFSHRDDYPSSYFPGFVGPGGREFFPAAYGSPETVDSTLWNPAIFVQDDVALGGGWSLLAGARLDGFFGRARDPLPGDTEQWHDRHDDSAVSWNISLSRALGVRGSAYATYQRAYAVHGNVTGGGLLLKEDENGRGVLDAEDFRNLSELAELGVKFAWLDNTLFAAAAVYDQRRTEIELGGDREELHLQGAELEFVFQPHARFNATFNLAYIDGQIVDSSPYQTGGRNLYDLYALGRGPGGRGTGAGFTFDNQVPVGDYPIPGLSDWVINGSLSYRLESGFGFGLSGSWQSDQAGNLDSQYRIPSQVFLNAFVFYRTPRWEVNLDVLNVLDERNWIHNGDAFTAPVLVFQDLPRRLEAYVKIRF